MGKLLNKLIQKFEIKNKNRHHQNKFPPQNSINHHQRPSSNRQTREQGE